MVLVTVILYFTYSSPAKEVHNKKGVRRNGFRGYFVVNVSVDLSLRIDEFLWISVLRSGRFFLTGGKFC